MSAGASIDRTSPPGRSGDDVLGDDAQSWIGLDFAERGDPRRTGTLVPLLILALVAALGVAALRIDLIRTRYALAAANEAEQALMEEQRALIARRRQLRDPTALAVEARERGFLPPGRVFSLPDPGEGTPPPPAVAAGPPRSGSR